MVGIVADNPDQRIPQKMVHAQVQHNFAALKKEEAGYKSLPKSQMDGKASRETYLRIKREVKAIVEDEVDRIMNTPGIINVTRKYHGIMA